MFGLLSNLKKNSERTNESTREFTHSRNIFGHCVDQFCRKGQQPQIGSCPMFELISLAANGGDTCALYGHCSSASKDSSKPKDPLSFSAHSSTQGIYTAEQVAMYRKCSTDYSSQFKIAWDGPFPGYGNKGYAPVDGVAKIESFRVCWEPLQLDYPVNPAFS